MIDTIAYGVTSAGLLGAVAALYYKIGKLETKINLIYDNIHIAMDWYKNNNRKRR